MTLTERLDHESPFLRIPATLRPAEPMGGPQGRPGAEELDSVMPGTDPEIAEEETSRKGMEKRADFQQALLNALKQPMKMTDVAWEIHRLLPTLKTPLGKFRQRMEQHAVAQAGAEAPFDLLPISVAALEIHPSIPEKARDWVALMGLVLSFHYCSGFSDPKYLRHPKTLTPIQERMAVQHLCPAAERLLENDPDLEDWKAVRAELDRKGHDYDGSTWVKMEDLNFDKVVSCWPGKEQAAVAPVTKFVTGKTLEDICNPMSSILPEEEWPAELPRSYVRATDDEWTKLVQEGFKRGLFHACPDDEVLRRSDGTAIVNGAGAVPKLKNGEMKQRFISILCPLNAVSRKIEGAEGTLPYVGQISLLHIPEESEGVIDSEDMASAFNLFEMPVGWRGLFVYEKKVPAHVLGLQGDKPTFVALRTIPMGWLSAVGIVQEAVRYLAFDLAKLPPEGEVLKWKELPEGQRFLLYLDSVDQLRVVNKTVAKLATGTPSAEHQRFTKACEEAGLPRNESKTLSGALAGTLQGGELRSREGVFSLQLDKMRLNIAMCLHLLGTVKWKRKDVAGVIGRVVFAAAFRRPILAVLEDVFGHLHGDQATRQPSSESYDEVLSLVALLPLAFTNVRAPVSKRLYATDASPSGAGSCIAVQLKRDQLKPETGDAICSGCRADLADMISEGTAIRCPRSCGKMVCCLECYGTHYHSCPHKESPVPLFSERWSGPNCPLTKAVLKEGIDVVEPYDVKRNHEMDFFAESGKRIWEDLDNESIAAEHHAPDCKTMSRARGRAFYIDGQRYEGPPALRDERNVMGFPTLKGAQAVQVRQGNRMALRSVKRCQHLCDAGRKFTLEHPYRSFLWYMKPTISLAEHPDVRMAVFSNCCFGGRRRKWTALLTNCHELFQALHRPECPHGDSEDYQPFFDDQGSVVYPTEQEAEYPSGLVDTYAKALKQFLEHHGMMPDIAASRKLWIEGELEKYHRMSNPELRGKVVSRILQEEQKLTAGAEKEALMHLLRNGHYRGTDVRLTVEHAQERQMVPYPAYRWVWRTQMAFKWKQEGHINELETQALAAHIRRILREDGMQQVRVMVVLDSQVLYFALGKGRSPSKRLNRLLRRIMALTLMGDMYIFPIWTLSAWNFADKPSRQP